MILLISLVLFLRLFQALLILALGMMNDDKDDDVVMESPRDDCPSLNTIIVSVCMLSVCRNVPVFGMWNCVVV